MKAIVTVMENVEVHKKFVVLRIHAEDGTFVCDTCLDSGAAKTIASQLLDAAVECESRVLKIQGGPVKPS